MNGIIDWVHAFNANVGQDHTVMMNVAGLVIVPSMLEHTGSTLTIHGTTLNGERCQMAIQDGTSPILLVAVPVTEERPKMPIGFSAGG